jgi:hypothetical protein
VREAAESACWFHVKSPESGSVLKLIAESEQTLAMGSPLMEVGDPQTSRSSSSSCRPMPSRQSRALTP